MTAKEAYLRVLKVMPVMHALSCYEYDSIFVFQMAPSYMPKNSGLLTGLTGVDKKTGRVKRFLPIDISHDEYSRGKKVPASVYGGE